MAVVDFGVNETFCNGRNLELTVLWNGDDAEVSAGYEPRCFDLSTSNSSLPPLIAKPPSVDTDNSTTTTTAVATNATNTTMGAHDGHGKSSAVSVTTLSQLALVVVAISCAVIGTV
jgi:hypothetical protein